MKVNKIKVATLTGPLLDKWAAKAGNVVLSKYPERAALMLLPSGETYSPSTDWSQGGPVIEREGIRWQPMPKDKYISWVSRAMENEGRFNAEYGSTLLEAAMRAYVTFKFGEEVDEI